MIQLMSGTWIAALLFAAAPATAPQEEAPWPARHLTVVVSSSAQPRHPRSPQAVTHAAEITIGPSIAWANLNIDQNELQGLLSTQAGSRISQAQRDLLKGKGALWHTGRRLDEGQQFFLYAVSEEDAAIMAQALVEVCDARVAEHIQWTHENLEKNRRLAVQLEAELTALKAEQARIAVESAEQKKRTSYADMNEAREDRLSLEKELRSLQVQRVGIQARVETIRRLIEERQGSRRPFDFLEQMLASEDVELAGILARQKALGEYVSLAEGFVDVEVRREACDRKAAETGNGLQRARNGSAEMKERLANPPANLKPLIVKDNTVHICPLSAPETTPAAGPGRMGLPPGPGEG